MKLQVETIWCEPDPLPVPDQLQSMLAGTPFLAQGLLRHGIRTPEQAQAFLDPRQYRLSDPYDFPDMDKAVARLLQAIQKRERIGVWGDFDVDGQTSTTLLFSSLQQLGAEVVYHIPVRAIEGHGVNLTALGTFLDQGVDIVLTCDTGISAHDAVDLCRQRGVDFLITDHHSLPDTLPSAQAVINPQRLPEDHPARTLSGVGAAWKLIAALSAELGKSEIARQTYDLTALGLVADVATLTGDARCLVQLGLRQLREARRPALRKMYEISEVDPANLSEQHIGFTIAPRLNAIGRLDDANPVVGFLMSHDPQTISVMSARLEGLNGERRFLTEQVFMGALAQIEHNPSILDSPALLLYNPDWPAGVVGIVANRLVEFFHRPAVLLSNPPGQAAHGSARSIEGVNITEAIAAGGEYLLGYGGHAMAAGLALEMDSLPAFQQRLNESVRVQIGERPLVKEIQVDAYLELSEVQLKLINELDWLAPFGAGNPAFVFATKNLRVVGSSPVGRTGEHLQVLVENERGETRRLIWWQGSTSLLPAGSFDLAYTLRSSNYRGQPEVQIEWLHARPTPEAALELAAARYEQIVDLRTVDEPLRVLPKYTDGDFLLWQEGLDLQPAAASRIHLRSAETVIIWNPPPGRAELDMAISTIQPKKIILFAVPTGADSPAGFLKQLTGMVRYALRNRGGEIEINVLAAALNQRGSAVEAGIRWLVARGFVRIIEETFGRFVLSEGGIPDEDKVKVMETALRSILQETAAFRAFYTRADPQVLFS